MDKNKPQNTLLTGSSGFLGRIIYDQLMSVYTPVWTLGRSEGVDFKTDLVKSSSVLPSCDSVIHVAGKAHSSARKAKVIKDFFEVNVTGTKNLLLSIELSGWFPRSFTFVSTVGVYGKDSGENISEDSPLLARDPYGVSKIQAEELILDWCKKNNVICTILRLPLLVGENPPGNLGAMISSIKNGYYFNIGGGLARKSMVLAEDVANIVFKASSIGGIYNLTDGYHPSFHELGIAIAKQNRKSKPFNMPYIVAKSIALFGDVVGSIFPLNSNKLKKITADLTFDDSRAREVLGWQPSKVIDWFTK